jgi:hypothetical protein
MTDRGEGPELRFQRTSTQQTVKAGPRRDGPGQRPGQSLNVAAHAWCATPGYVPSAPTRTSS